MNIEKNINNETLTFILDGRIDTVTAPSLETELNQIDDSIVNLIFDFAKISYISSAGLRVMLKAQKMIAAKGSMKVINVCESVKEVFDITGFSDILDIE